MAEPRLTDPGALLATTHEAGEGLRVRLRLARPSDALGVREFLEQLTPDEPVPSAVVRDYTFVDPRKRLVVAASAPLGGRNRVVGLADVELTGTGVAELGVRVDERARNRGIGKLLTEAVASLAIQQGATHLRGELPGTDGPVIRLMERLGPTSRTIEDGAEVLYTELPAPRRRAA
ncbi:MAG TPA: GNAT family N-acetyltransferase [Thermoleophilaceae bacterium]